MGVLVTGGGFRGCDAVCVQEGEGEVASGRLELAMGIWHPHFVVTHSDSNLKAVWDKSTPWFQS